MIAVQKINGEGIPAGQTVKDAESRGRRVGDQNGMGRNLNSIGIYLAE